MQYKSVLAIDWGRKRIGMAYKKSSNSIVFPIGSLDNNGDVFMHISGILVQHSVDHIILGRPVEYSPTQEAIEAFAKKLAIFCPPDCKIEFVNEDYSSIQANAREGVFKKTPAEDSLAAAFLLEEYVKE